jgi:hypothetical protein
VSFQVGREKSHSCGDSAWRNNRIKLANGPSCYTTAHVKGRRPMLHLTRSPRHCKSEGYGLSLIEYLGGYRLRYPSCLLHLRASAVPIRHRTKLLAHSMLLLQYNVCFLNCIPNCATGDVPLQAVAIAGHASNTLSQHAGWPLSRPVEAAQIR